MGCDCCDADVWKPLFEDNGYTLARCAECGLHSVDRLPDPSQRVTDMEEGHYAESDVMLDADRQARTERAHRATFDRYVEVVRHHQPAGRWLEVGCGAGVFMTMIKRAGYDVQGIELNRERRLFAERSTSVPVHGVPVEDAGFADASFDVVSIINVFSHFTSPSRTMAELHRILRPGGVLLVVTGELLPGIQRSHMREWYLGDHLHFLGDGTINRYCDQLGFELVAHDRQWLPEVFWSRETFESRGPSTRRNVAKALVSATPGALSAVRALMLRREAGNAAHSTTMVLRRR